jgi:hypothetical protein
LADFINKEAVDEEDWAMRGLMASLGIEKGKPFEPDTRMKEILGAGAEVGMKMCHALRFGEKLKNTKYWPDRQPTSCLPSGRGISLEQRRRTRFRRER